ncbi:unnamed protein product, partial [Prorocentrum cordatum]
GFSGDVVRFHAELGREALRQMVLEGRGLAWERRRRRLPRDLGAHLGGEPRSMVEWHGDECGLDAGVLEAARRRLRGKRPLAAGARAPEDADTVLLVAELHAGGGLELGDGVIFGGADVAQGSKVIGRRTDGRPVLCERVGISAVDRGLADLRVALREAPRGEVEGAATGPEDVRTLAVDWNEQGARVESGGAQSARAAMGALGGCELRGAGTALHLRQRFAQHGGDSKTLMSNFCQGCSISQRGRTYHELNCLVAIFWLAGTFDAVNLGGLACLEVAASHVAQITE